MSNNRYISTFLFLCFLCFSLSGFAQVVIKAPNVSSIASSQVVSSMELKSKCHLISIAVDEFKDMSSLNSAANLQGVRFAAEHVLPLSYYSVNDVYLHGKVNSNDVLAELDKIAKAVTSRSLVIVVLASHGDLINGEYYFITSDTQINRITRTAVSGAELRDVFEEMASTGAKVLVFIDTCHASALFNGGDYKGNVYYCASSDFDEYSREIENKSQFSIKLGQILSSAVPETQNNNYITWYGIQAQLQAAVETVGKSYGQTFVSFPNSPDFPVLKYRQVESVGFYIQSLLPWKCSDNNAELDYAMIAVEAASVASILICGSLQEYYKHQIRKYDSYGLSTDRYKQRGRSCAIGCCVSAGTLLSSYLLRTLHVNKEYSVKYSGQKIASLGVFPTVSNEYAGMSFALRF